MFDESKVTRVPKGSPEGGQFTSHDGNGGAHIATPAEEERLSMLGIEDIASKKGKIILPKKEYAGLCSAIRTTFADKIPFVGQIFYDKKYYQFRYNKSQEEIICTFYIMIEGNQEYINDIMENFKNA